MVLVVASGLRGSKRSPTTAAGRSTPTRAVTATTRAADAHHATSLVTAGGPTPTVLGPRYVELDGSGDAVRRVRVPAHQAVILYAIYNGSSRFSIEARSSSGASLGDPVNAFGVYRGTTIVDGSPGQFTATLKITTDSLWHIELYPVSMGDGWDGRTAVGGTGDEVLVLPAALTAAEPITVSNVGASNFVVTAYTAGGPPPLLVNELGVVTRPATIPVGTTMVSIVSDGQWTVTPGA